METKNNNNTERPLQYDEVREVLNTPPPALIVKTNLLVITILMAILLVIAFVKLPITYEPKMNFLEPSIQKFSQTIMYEYDVKIVKKHIKDRVSVKKGDRLLTLHTPLDSTDILSLFNGKIVFAKLLIEGAIIPKNTPIGWIKSSDQKKDTIKFYVSMDDIHYFKINQQILLKDKENKRCEISPIQMLLQENKYLISAIVDSHGSNFNYSNAKFSIVVAKQTILEQLLNKKIFAK